jgi:hypothetical protein
MAKVLHASYSGYFPACIQTAPEDKSNLVGGTLEQIMELYWRVKAWRLDSVSGSVNFDYGEGGVDTFTYTASEQTLGSVNAISETNLVCNPRPLISATANYLFSYSGGSDNRSLQVRLNTFPSSSGGNFYKENEIYYMEFYFDMIYVGNQSTPYQVGSVTINGLSVPLYASIDGPPPTNITGNISASISPIAYWTYGL